MATSTPSLPTGGASDRAGGAAPPNFYAQAAAGHQPLPVKADHSVDNQKFRMAMEKLMKAFTYLEQLRPNGQNIAPEVKAMAASLKVAEQKAFGSADEPNMEMEGEEGAEGAAAGKAGVGAGAGKAGPTGAGTAQVGGAAGTSPMTPMPGGMGA